MMGLRSIRLALSGGRTGVSSAAGRIRRGERVGRCALATTDFFVGSSRRRDTFTNTRDGRAPQKFAAGTADPTENL